MYIRRVKIRNVRSFGELDLDFTRPDGTFAGWTVLAGRNGSGKSTLLRALALAVAGPEAARVLNTSFADWIRVGESEAEVQVQLEFSSVDHLEHLDLVSGWARLRWDRSKGDQEPAVTGNLPARTVGPNSSRKPEGFDVLFISNPADEKQVEQIAIDLEGFGVQSWQEKRNLRPGLHRLETLSKLASKAPAMAVFIGEGGPETFYQQKQPELWGIINNFSKLNRPLIPVFLANSPTASPHRLPAVLEGFSFIDVKKDEDFLQRLYWGIKGESEARETENSGLSEARSRGWFICAYGPYRRLTGHATDAQRLMAGPESISRLVSLFREDSSLIECVEWLREIYLQRLEEKPGAADIERVVLSFLNDGLLPDGVHVERIDSEGLWVTQHGVKLPLSELSDGYRTTAALVTDIIRHLYRESPATSQSIVSEETSGQRILQTGVVLIDEVDLHLHIEWQKRFGFWLKRHFPNIQFIVTTHSPFVCQAADLGGLIRLAAPGDGRSTGQVSEELYNTIVNGSADDAVLTDLFGLETPYSDEAEHLRQRVAWLEARIQAGRATDQERSEFKELRSRLPQNMPTDVEQALRKLAIEG